MGFFHKGDLEIIKARLELIEIRIDIMNAQIKLFTDKANSTLDALIAAIAAGGIPSTPLGSDDVKALSDFQLRLDAELAAVTKPSNVVSITSAGTVATVTDTAHGFLSGQTRTIEGATGPDSVLFNGPQLITVTDADHFTYVMTGVPASATATGTITAK